ncbi:MAG: PQQ-dependent sugar dehydrogenase [Gammaproteobacteria bacterium]|nr:PQQ-dependent sugar dehydrogenase [Gammaproteobacteria bacterium]
MVERKSDQPKNLKQLVPKGVEAQSAGSRPTDFTDHAPPSLAALNIRDARLQQVFAGLEHAWAFEFLDSDNLIITEKDARMSVLKLSTGQLQQLRGLPRIAISKVQTGLLDVALHPRFASNRRLYFSYVAPDHSGRYFTTAVATAILQDLALTDVQDIVRLQPYGWSPSNFGGALAFDDAGYLYVSIGDRSEQMIAQDGSSLAGKILRLHDDGRVPEDNPHVDDPLIDARIYALGVRNPQGLHYDVASGLLIESEHGPMGGDEINLIRAGHNYGWPLISYGQNYTLEGIGLNPQQADNDMTRLHFLTHPDAQIGAGEALPGMQQPLFYYLPSRATSPLLLYRGSMFPEWDGDLLVGMLKGQHVSKLDFAIDHLSIRSEHAMLGELKDRVRDIKTAQDGSLFVLTQNRGLWRLYRQHDNQDAAVVDTSNPGQIVYRNVCTGCHDDGVGGAPMLGNKQDWQSILQQDTATTYNHTLDGYGNMPARGLCNLCTDEQVTAAVDYMLKKAVNSD